MARRDGKHMEIHEMKYGFGTVGALNKRFMEKARKSQVDSSEQL